MKQIIDIVVTPAQAADELVIKNILQKQLKIQDDFNFHITKRSIDARAKQARINLKIEIYVNENLPQVDFNIPDYTSVKNAKQVIIIGCGPAGIFAAIHLIKNGLKPIIYERGKDVRARRFDLAKINKEGIVNPESNYCFGEGGAGTYSDGKLYTRSDKRGDVQSVLNTFVQFGASTDILIEAHPHIGTNKLPKIIEAMRHFILNAGGEIHFNSKCTDINFAFGKITGIEINHTEKIKTEQLILATGHSARDIFELLHSNNIVIEAKPFALGVRIEHPQEIIDSMQYHCEIRDPLLPPASYNFTEQTNGKAAYSFCMCPGGIIAPCATSQEEIVTNGWSPSKRNNPFANSGFVVNIDLKDMNAYEKFGAMQGLQFQKSVEHAAWKAGGCTQAAPAQRMVDFVENKVSNNLPDCSYQPGIVSYDLSQVLPAFVAENLRQAFKQIQKKRNAYFTNEAVLVATESRTSSPVRIPRNSETLQHIQIAGLYPCGEGAGYAGGIVSAAMDGIRIAEKIANEVVKN
ncbi:MAG: FAD-dependent oxidoreductase [Bacteroidetes bacterium]|nr:FAD-dependent oxidoreductase [Bacteroidota bacterium]